MFRFRGPLVRGDTPGELFLRSVLLVAIFVGVAAAFWHLNGKTMREIRSRGAVWDEAQLLTKDQKDALRAFAAVMNENFGVKLRVHIRKDAVELPAIDNKTLFLGVSPASRQVLVDFPPLMRKALGDDYMYKLQNEHFTPYFERNDWQSGLADALGKLWKDMGGN